METFYQARLTRSVTQCGKLRATYGEAVDDARAMLRPHEDGQMAEVLQLTGEVRLTEIARRVIQKQPQN